METKKILWITAGITAVGVIVMWYRNRESNATSAADANAQQTAQDDAELAAMMMEQPLSTGTDNSGASVSGPTVDTGNNALQTLINSILNPTPTTPPVTTTPPTSSVPVTSTPSTPVATTPQPVGPAQPVSPVTAPVTVPVTVNNTVIPAQTMPGYQSEYIF